MRVEIKVFGVGTPEQDTLESRMVDVLLEELKETLEQNHVPITITKTSEEENAEEEINFNDKIRKLF